MSDRLLTADAREDLRSDVVDSIYADDCQTRTQLDKGLEALDRLAHSHYAAEATIEAQRALLGRLTGADQPWPLADVLRRLADAVEHMQQVHGCDRHGYEEDYACIDAGRRYAVALTPEPHEPDDGLPPLVSGKPAGG